MRTSVFGLGNIGLPIACIFAELGEVIGADINPEVVEKIIAKERPDALLPTLGGQTGLNVAIEVAKRGVLKKYKVQMWEPED